MRRLGLGRRIDSDGDPSNVSLGFRGTVAGPPPRNDCYPNGVTTAPPAIRVSFATGMPKGFAKDFVHRLALPLDHGQTE